MPRAAKKKAPPEGTTEPEAQRPRPEELPTSFEVDEKAVTSLLDDPWHVSRRGVVIKPFTSWWDPTDKSTDRSENSCAIVGYVDAYTYADGSTDAGYILENSSYYYMMEPKGVWALLPVKERPVAAEESDDEDMARDGVDDEEQDGGAARRGSGGGAARRGRPPAAGARVLPPNAPRLGDEFAEEIAAIVDELHGTKEATEETIDEETGEVKTKAGKSQRQPSGWEDSTHAEKPEYCALPKDVQLKQPIPRKYHAMSGKPCTWRIVDSFRLCWPVIPMVTAGSNEYYDYHVELNEEKAEGAKKLTLSHSSWPAITLNQETGEGEGGITEAHYEGYLAIIFFMGVIQCADQDWHWRVPGASKKDMPDWHHNFVRRIMGRDDFHLMRRFLHYSDPRKKVPRGDWKAAASGKKWVAPPDGYDMIHNFRPIMDECNLQWCALVCLVAILTYDEQMVKCAMHTKLSRRQPNKPIRDGFQIFALSAACGSWCYCCWIDQGKNDPNLYPPYAYGWHAAVILHVCALANVTGTWATIAFDQAFPTPALFLALARLGIYAVGTCQQNRRGFPSLQMAEQHKEREGGFKSFKVVGQVLHMCHGVSIGGKWVFLLALQWFDKNVVTMMSNKHGDTMKPYEYKQKGEVDPQESQQPETREEYNDNNNGTDLVDQRNSATINPHGSKETIWHRMHDHYANQGSHQACTHFRLVIDAHGTPEQKREINGWRGDDGKRHGGLRTDDLRWMLMAQLAENAQFGTEGDPRVCNLRRGSISKQQQAATAARETPSPVPMAGRGSRSSLSGSPPESVAEEDESRAGAVPTAAERRQGCAHVLGQAEERGRCVMCRHEHAGCGCKTCGVRLCGPGSDQGFACINSHLDGVKNVFTPRKKVEWMY